MPIPIPTGGLHTETPAHLIAPNSLSDGSYNVFIDIDGQLKPRKGYTPLNAAPTIGVRIMGGINFTQTDTTRQTIVGTLTGFWYNNAGVWTALTGSARTGVVNSPVRFTTFFTSGVTHALSCDFADKIADWDGTSSSYSTIAASPIARDLISLNERVLCVYTIESAVHYPRRIRWSANLDQTTWPTNAFNDMSDSDDPLITVRKLGRTSAAAYGEKSIWSVTASPGDDANAFVAEEIFAASGYPGPISAAAVTIIGGLHYYMAHDGRIYTFDGINPPNPISAPIDKTIQNIIVIGNGDRFHSCYLPSIQYALFFFTANTSAAAVDPNVCAALHIPSGRWEPLWYFADILTCSFSATDQSTLTWANDTYTWNTNPYTWNLIPSGQTLDAYVGGDGGNVFRFFQSPSDNTAPIPFAAYSALFSPGPNQVALLDRAEVYTTQTSDSELITIQFDGFGAPNRPPRPVVSVAGNLADPSWVNAPILPGPLNPANTMSNYLRMSIRSSAAPGFAMAGGTLYLNTDTKGDYGNQ